MNNVEENQYYEIEKRIYHDVNITTEIPEKFKKCIQTIPHRKKKQYSILKMVTVACAIISVSAGIVYAGATVSKKIFKQPQKTVGFYSDERAKEYAIAKQERESVISEEEAKKQAKELLIKYEHEDEEIQSAELINSSEDYGLVWFLKTNKDDTISINAKDTRCFSVEFRSVEDKKVEPIKISDEEAKEQAKKLCEKYGYDLSDYTHVRVKATRYNFEDLKDERCIRLYVDFLKTYDGLICPYGAIRIGFVPKTNEICSFTVGYSKYEDNPIEITEEQAKNIALEEEQKIKTKYDIKDIKIELNIVGTNGIAYFRTKDYEHFYNQLRGTYLVEDIISYRVEKHIRKAYVVTLRYDIPEPDGEYNEFEYEYFSYFVDATTGEIIGGDIDFESTKELLYE